MSRETEVAKGWRSMLGSTDREEQMRALTAIGRAGAGRFSGTPFPGRAAQRTEGKISEELGLDLRDLVMQKLRDADPEIRAEAALAVVVWGDTASAQALLELLEDGNEGVQRAAIQSLSVVPTERAVHRLLDLAQAALSPQAVRAQALATIAAIGGAGDEDTANIAFGAVRTRGPSRARAGSVEERLSAIERDDSSLYVRFLASRARSRVQHE